MFGDPATGRRTGHQVVLVGTRDDGPKMTSSTLVALDSARFMDSTITRRATLPALRPSSSPETADGGRSRCDHYVLHRVTSSCAT